MLSRMFESYRVDPGLTKAQLLSFEKVIHQPRLVEVLGKLFYRTHPKDLNASYDLKTPGQAKASGDNKFIHHYGDQTRILASSLEIPADVGRYLELSEEMYQQLRKVARFMLCELAEELKLSNLVADVLDPWEQTNYGLVIPSNNHLRSIAYMGTTTGVDTGIVDISAHDLASPHYDLSILSIENGASRQGYYWIDEDGVRIPHILAPGDVLGFLGLGLPKYILTHLGINPPDEFSALGHGAENGGEYIFDHQFEDTLRLTGVGFFSTNAAVCPVSSTVEEARGANAAIRANLLGIN